MQIKTYLLGALFFGLTLGAQAQFFNRTYFLNNDETLNRFTRKAVTQVNEELVVTVGGVRPVGQTDLDAHLMAVDNAGNVIWTRRYGFEGLDESLVAVIPADNGTDVIAIGFARRPDGGGSNDLLAMRVDAASGTLIWSNYYGQAEEDEVGQALISIDGQQDQYLLLGKAAWLAASKSMPYASPETAL